MSALQTYALVRAKAAAYPMAGVRAALSTPVARRLHLDRAVDFWLGEASAVWSLEQHRARVVAVHDETHDVRTFVLRPGPGWPGHEAGQFVPVELEIDGARVRRCYSIASAPGGRTVSITVKRVAGGRVSAWMHDRLRVGDVVGLGAPAGEFTLSEPTPGPLLLLSGGSGVTPVMSMLRDLVARGAVRDVVFLHCARTGDDVIFGAELAELALNHPGLRVVLRLDDRSPPGGLDGAALTALVPDLPARRTFLCGPPGMMAQIEKVFASYRLSGALRTERFVAARAPDVDAGVAGHRVHLTMAGRTVTPTTAGTLLEQLERAGERPANGCRMGICGTCRCRKRRGTVVDAITGRVSSEPDEDIRLCVSLARSDVELGL